MLTDISAAAAVALTLTAQAATAQDLSPFQSRVEVQRDQNNKITRIMLKGLNLQVTNYVRDMGMLVTALRDNPKFRSESVASILASQEYGQWSDEYKQGVQNAVEYLRQPELAAAFRDPKFQAVMTRVAAEINLHLLDFKTLARPYEPLAFYYSEAAEKLIRTLLDLAGSSLGGPAYGLAKYLIFRMVDFGYERRDYFQSYLLHHIETFGPAALGLNNEEADLVRSSIYDARITWWKFWKAKKAKKNWSNWGNERLADDQGTCSDRASDRADELGAGPQSLDFIFVEGRFDDGIKVMNLLDGKSAFNGSPSLAFDEAEPNKLLVQRILLEVLKLGLSMAPVPGVVMKPFEWFVDSMYMGQIRSEGSFLAYLESMHDGARARIAIRQSINPFTDHLPGMAPLAKERYGQELLNWLQ
jgi:hypothetical protein